MSYYAPELLDMMPDLQGAVCANKMFDPDIWFPTSIPEWKKAMKALKPICDQCPAFNDCLKFALDNDIRDGIWAGTSPSQRRKMSAKGDKNKEVRLAHRKLHEIRRLMSIGLTKERACSEVGLSAATFERYEYREAAEWTETQPKPKTGKK